MSARKSAGFGYDSRSLFLYESHVVEQLSVRQFAFELDILAVPGHPVDREIKRVVYSAFDRYPCSL